ncbi:acetylcholine receptor subunit alpha-type acr-16-like [Ischnura elegans]|uniref:acetylcholine receptor subunit alpha-type acr-16-like n=1 Tax=Ischnura elegans TaxID=197161 RepID=UPI001ED8A89A|nr:acetylcholine receptor subunit alpha-type acr-16-like [Ischnura elegans]
MATMAPHHSSSFCRVLAIFTLMLIWCCLLVKSEPGSCRAGVTKDLTPNQRLRQDVFCSYDKDVRPVVQYSKNLTVSVLMMLRFFTFEEVSNVLQLNSWMYLSWNDSHLTWTPADYGNISQLDVNTREIWVPDLSIYNSGDMNSDMTFKRTDCIVDDKGHVQCVPVAKWPVHCTPNLREWPYDLHECSMILGSWSYTGELLDFDLLHQGITLDDFLGNREWELKNVSAVKEVKTYDCCPNQTYPLVMYKFILKRHASAYLATVVIPSMIMALLTLSTFWLDPKAPERLAVCSVSVLCHCLYLQYLGAKLPSNGDITPLIVLFFRDSLVLTGAALILSVILLRLSLPTSTPSTTPRNPTWYSKLFDVIQNQRIQLILCLGQLNSKSAVVRGDGATLIDNGKESNEEDQGVFGERAMFLVVIDRLAFLIFALTYFVFLIALIPTNQN